MPAPLSTSAPPPPSPSSLSLFPPLALRALGAFAESLLLLQPIQLLADGEPQMLSQPQPPRPLEACVALAASAAGPLPALPPVLAVPRAAGEAPPAAALPIFEAQRRSAAPHPSSWPRLPHVRPRPPEARPAFFAAPRAVCPPQPQVFLPPPPVPFCASSSLHLPAWPAPAVPARGLSAPRAAGKAPPGLVVLHDRPPLCVAPQLGAPPKEPASPPPRGGAPPSASQSLPFAGPHGLLSPVSTARVAGPGEPFADRTLLAWHALPVPSQAPHELLPVPSSALQLLLPACPTVPA
mmetsp:Transcript_2002/g.4835  ORF Transcript_2002/g.4835 Transcript_2002/m.4835 type:complete len:294 (-) Transcript_2002:190-1071(-)